MRTARIKFEGALLEVTLSPDADPDRLPMAPVLTFGGRAPRWIRRHEIPVLDRQRIADHVVSWNITNQGEPIPCSWPGVMEVLKWPQIYSALLRELDTLLSESESAHA